MTTNCPGSYLHSQGASGEGKWPKQVDTGRRNMESCPGGVRHNQEEKQLFEDKSETSVLCRDYCYPTNKEVLVLPVLTADFDLGP